MKIDSKDCFLDFFLSEIRDDGYIFKSGTARLGDCFKYRRIDFVEATEIVIPEGVHYISPYAFINCFNLKKVTFPSTLRRIGRRAFECCKSLEEIKFLNPLVIDENAFRFCENLKTVEIGFTKSRKYLQLCWREPQKPGELPRCRIENDDYGYINTGAFRDCPSLKEVKLCELMYYSNSDEDLIKVNIIGGRRN